jgi:hypothetical protein
MSLDRTEMTGLQGHDSDIKRAVDKGVWAEQLEQDSQPGQESRDRRTGTGKLGKSERPPG